MKNNWLVIFFIGIATSGWAQSEWMLDVHVTYTHPGCMSQNIDIVNVVFNGQNVGLQGDVTGTPNEYQLYLKGTNWAGVANKMISIAVKGTCSDVFLPAHDLSVFSTYCST